MKPIFLLLSLCCLLTSCLEGEGEPYSWQRNYESVTSDFERGAVNFIYSDFESIHGQSFERGGAFPWRIVEASIRFANGELNDQDFQKKLKEQGLLFPKPGQIANLPSSVKFERFKNTPLGIVRGNMNLKAGPIQLGNIDSAVIGCATCHASPGYTAEGDVQLNKIWLGSSSPSFNPEGFISEIYKGLKYSGQRRKAFEKYFSKIFPNAPEGQGKTIKRLFGPVNKSIKEFAESGLSRLMPQDNGGPGRTNGVGSLKNYMGAYTDYASFHQTDRGYTSIPVTFDRQFRSSFLVDGAYGVPQKNHFAGATNVQSGLSPKEMGKIVSVFTIPTSGNTVSRVPKSFQYAEEVAQFLSRAERERFPGLLDQDKIQQGQKLYQKQCQSCHGIYNDDLKRPQLVYFPNRLIPQGEIGTDSARIESIDTPLMTKLSESGFTDYVSVRQTGGYVAPLLSQVWKTAPYLHNGSIPTLASLMGLEPRPKLFMTGGHHLDFNKVGIRGEVREGVYKYNYRPWSQPEIYDTSQRGQSNKGHEKEFKTLSEQDKLNILEYLKLL